MRACNRLEMWELRERWVRWIPGPDPDSGTIATAPGGRGVQDANRAIVGPDPSPCFRVEGTSGWRG